MCSKACFFALVVGTSFSALSRSFDDSRSNFFQQKKINEEQGGEMSYSSACFITLILGKMDLFEKVTKI